MWMKLMAVLQSMGMARICGIIILAIACTSFVGHMAGHPYLYEWGAQLGMGLPTAVCFILVAFILFNLSTHFDK